MAYRKKGKFGMGMYSGIQVRVQRAIDMDAYQILIFRRGNNGKMYVVKQMELVWEEIGDGTRFNGPSLTIDGMLAGDLLDALLEEMGNRGVRTQEDSKITGLYEATCRHLRDMRKLVFKGEDHDKEEDRDD